MIKDKKAVMGEALLTLYRLFIVSIIAFFILGISAVFYDYQINTGDVESAILTKVIYNCVAPESLIDSSSLNNNLNLFEYCKIKGTNVYAKIIIKDKDGNEIKNIEGGNNHLVGIDEFLTRVDKKQTAAERLFDISTLGSIIRYKPGQTKMAYPILISDKQQLGTLEIYSMAGNAE